MKNGLIFKLGTVAVLTVSSFAHMHGENKNYSGMGMHQQNSTNYPNHMGMNNHHMSGNYYNHNMMGYGMMNGHMMGYGMMNGPMMHGPMMGHGMMNGPMMGGNISNFGMTNGQMMNSHMLLPKIMMLNLSNEQVRKIREVLYTHNTKFMNPNDAISSSNFDKKKYLQTIENNRKAMIEMHVDKLFKIHSLLSKEQKEQLKRMLN